MTRIILCGILAVVLFPDLAAAQATPCNGDAAWRRVRLTYPIHRQTLAKCENKQSGEHVIVLTEPPPHLVRGKAEPIVRALFSVPITSVQRRRHQLGYDGWVEDLVIVVRPRTPDQIKALGDDLALLSVFAFGSAYKAEVEDISRLSAATYWDAPPALEVRAEELFAWLLGTSAESLVPLDGGDAATLQQRVERNETGTYQTGAPGLIVALLPSGSAGELNDHIDDFRRFAVDTDAFLGALKLKNNRIALVGRERTAPIASVPPLRVETILLLASNRSAQLSQSYERNRAFAGKLLSGAGDLFGWDWAPILLSDILNDTEFGSLLNFTDNMLKGWSESGKVDYKGFKHDKPRHFPFGTAGAFETIGSKRLTYNWNTAGVGLLSRRDGVEIFSVRNTGSLPVSYFPEGSVADAAAKAKLVKAEDDAYKYFSTLRSPMLERAVQYTALYQVFQAFDVRAKPPHDPAAQAASISNVERILQSQVITALRALSNPSTPSTADHLLFTAYVQMGVKGQEFESKQKPEYAESIRKIQASVQRIRNEMAAMIAALDQERTASWRDAYAKERATRDPMPDDLRQRVKDLTTEELALVLPPNQVRKAVLEVSARDPEGWIRTPTIVVSQGEMRSLVGGHNIGGRATRVEIDAAVPKGQVRASGSYYEGRVIRVNPADAPAARDLVRTFDREVGLDDFNIRKGVTAIETKLREAPVVPLPVRNMPAALDHGGTATRPVRGAQQTANATTVGYRPGAISAKARPQIEAIAEQSQAQVVVARVDEGFVIFRSQPKPPKATLAPNHTSLMSALDREVRTAAIGPPPAAHPKIVFHQMAANEPALILRTMAARAQAAGGAGGKPPFGGRRPPLAFDDAPGPGGHFWRGAAREPRVDAAARGKIAAEGLNSDRVLAAKPQWQAAELSFPPPDSVLFAKAPEFTGAGRHFVEVRVPVALERSGGVKTMIVNAIAAFRNKLTAEATQEINAAVTKLFKSPSEIDLREALTRYKNMMMNQFKSDDIWINLRQEGVDVIVTEAPGEAHTRG